MQAGVSKILEIYMCCQYFLQHDASPLFDKYQIRNWYRDVCTKEIEDVNVALDAMQQEYDAVFLIKPMKRRYLNIIR